MAENVEERRGRRGRWLVLAVVLAIGTWVVRSRRAARADVGTGWPPPRPADAGAEWQRPGGTSRPEVDARATVAAAPAGPRPSPAPVGSAAARTTPDAPRRPSPRPRAAAPDPRPEPARDDLPTGAAAPLPDGSAPDAAYTIKGKAASMLFHSESSPYFARTKADVWFRTAEDARAAGFTEWTPRKR